MGAKIAGEWKYVAGDPPTQVERRLSAEARQEQPVPTGTKHDEGKTDWSILPWPEIEKVAKVLEYGAGKYGRDNWVHVPDADRRYFNAAVRHLLANAELDDESGLPHYAHAICCLLFLMQLHS